MTSLPHMDCPRVVFEVLDADAAAAPWTGINPAPFGSILTGSPPAQPTWVRTAHDGAEWRVLFHCQDSDPWATLTERDAPLYTEETVEVFFDPVGDGESYYEFEVNPLGTLLDIVFRRSRSGYKGDWAWNCDGLRAAVRKDDRSWTAELAIPFSSVCDELPTRARVNFCRIDRPSRDGSLPRELTAWSPPLRENFHTPERFGTIAFL